ncbi:MAG: DUF547 domain-containing protein [candidate division Zixibacteria bacterium]
MRTMLLLIAVTVILGGCGEEAQLKPLGSHPVDHSWQAYGNLLSDFVQDGWVDYRTLKSDRARLDSLINALSGADIDSATADERLAFYINAYNIITLASIVAAYPVESIKDIDGVWGKKKWSVGDQSLTLNEIEHEILRKEFDEPRIHMAVNCASIGCPPLRSEPYFAEQIDAQLEKASVKFCLSEKYNQLSPETSTAKLSSLFDWYGDDFVESFYDPDAYSKLSRKENASLSFVLSHYPDNQAEQFRKPDYQVEYVEYDWNLNEIMK